MNQAAIVEYLKELDNVENKPYIELNKQMMISELLKEYRRDVIRIDARPISFEPHKDPLTAFNSKFLGLPFFPSSLEYPYDKNGDPMIMISQINFSEIPNIKEIPLDGIFQLFLSPTNWHLEESKTYYHTLEDLDLERIKDFSFLNVEFYEKLPISGIHKLSFEKDHDYGSLGDYQFGFDFGNIPSEEQRNEIEKSLNASGHRIGGYSNFRQEDPREKENMEDTKDEFQLLQIDDDFNISFGDSGIAHVFIDKLDLAKRDFSKAYFQWDCY